MHCYCETNDAVSLASGIGAHFDNYQNALLWAYDEIFQAAENYGGRVSLHSHMHFDGCILEARDDEGMLLLGVTVHIVEGSL